MGLPTVEPVCPPDMEDCSKKCRFSNEANYNNLTSCDNPCICYGEGAIFQDTDGKCLAPGDPTTCPLSVTITSQYSYFGITDPSWTPTGNETRMVSLSWAVSADTDPEVGTPFFNIEFPYAGSLLNVANNNRTGTFSAPTNTNQIDFLLESRNLNFSLAIEISCTY